MTMVEMSLAPVPPTSRLALVAPASPPEPDHIDKALRLLRGWGYDVVEGPHLRCVDPELPYLAGSDRQRAEDMQWALCDDSIDAVICARGGYGSERILDCLDPAAIRAARAKPCFGSSDITALHAWLYRTCGRADWFSPMPATTAILDDEVARHDFHRALLAGIAKQPAFLSSTSTLISAQADSHVVGRLRGGNLSLLAEACAGAAANGFDEPTIALLEDVHEPVYHIDALIRQLLHAGWFDHVVAIALGSWLECAQDDVIMRIMRRNLDALGVPIVPGFQFGHASESRTIPLGVMGYLDVHAGQARLGWTAGESHDMEKGGR